MYYELELNHMFLICKTNLLNILKCHGNYFTYEIKNR